MSTAIAAAVARHYDELDLFYRDIWGEHVHHGLWRSTRDTPERAVEQLIDHVVSALDLSAGEEVVDVGAGYGATARYLAARYAVRVTGYTVSAAQYAYGARHHTPGVRMMLQDWHANGLPDQAADAVIAIESTEHMADLGFALAEMRRVLRPGGRVAICAWLAGEHVTGWQRRFLLDPTIRAGRLVTLTSPSRYRGLLEEAGFAGATFHDLTAAVSRTWTVCARRLLWRLMSDSRYMRYVLSSGGGERRFLPAVLRMIAAYACGAMRYGLFAGQLER